MSETHAEVSDRRDQWSIPPRPEWVSQFNALGPKLDIAGNPRNLRCSTRSHAAAEILDQFHRLCQSKLAWRNPVDSALDDNDKGFAMVPAQRIGLAHEIAAASLLLASDEASFIIGAELAIDGGWTAGSFNPMLSGAPDDSDYGLRADAHAISSALDDAFKAKAGERP